MLEDVEVDDTTRTVCIYNLGSRGDWTFGIYWQARVGGPIDALTARGVEWRTIS